MKLAFYFTQHESLGHTTRVVNILNSLKEKFGDNIEILILHGGKKQRFVDLRKYGKVIDLPFSTGKEYFYKDALFSRLMDLNGSAILKKRVYMMKRALLKFQPDIFITEYFPIGKEVWYLEIPPILKFVKNKIKSKIISSVGYPACEDESYQMIKKFYDFVLFHCSKNDVDAYVSTLEVENLNSERFLKILADFHDKIHFTGYVLKKMDPAPPKKIKRDLGISSEHKMVTVSRGGGVIYPKIISSTILARKMIKDEKICFLVSTGPSTEERTFRLYSSIVNKMENIKIIKYLPNFENYLNAADLSVNMNGYNTTIELLYLKKQNISIPSSSIEQRYKANMLKKFNLAEIIDYKKISGKLLKETVIKKLEYPSRPSKNVDGISFDGAMKTADFIEKIGG